MLCTRAILHELQSFVTVARSEPLATASTALGNVRSACELCMLQEVARVDHSVFIHSEVAQIGQ